MARKGITISLAAKCQLLFGLAVLVIIAGALAVPWQRMEQLAGQPNIKAGRFAADLMFRQIHAGDVGAAVTESAAATSRPRPNWNDVAISDTDYPRPRLIKVPRPGAEISAAVMGEDPIALQAVRAFQARASESEYWRVMTLADKTRVYRYAAAVRLDASCLKCHEEYAAWVKPGHVIPTALMPATMPAATTPTSVPATTSASAPATAPVATPVGTRPSDLAAPTLWPIVGVIRIDVPYQTDENQLLLNRIVIVVAVVIVIVVVVFVVVVVANLIMQFKISICPRYYMVELRVGNFNDGALRFRRRHERRQAALHASRKRHTRHGAMVQQTELNRPDRVFRRSIGQRMYKSRRVSVGRAERHERTAGAHSAHRARCVRRALLTGEAPTPALLPEIMDTLGDGAHPRQAVRRV